MTRCQQWSIRLEWYVLFARSISRYNCPKCIMSSSLGFPRNIMLQWSGRRFVKFFLSRIPVLSQNWTLSGHFTPSKNLAHYHVCFSNTNSHEFSGECTLCFNQSLEGKQPERYYADPSVIWLTMYRFDIDMHKSGLKAVHLFQDNHVSKCSRAWGR